MTEAAASSAPRTTSATPSPAASAEPRPSLRERKKLRTRQALVDTALELFTERGFDGATLDELCDAVEVSKRTFFRTFSSKEDVAMAPTQDLWKAFLEDLETREPAEGDTLVELLQSSLFGALRRMPSDGWARRVLLSQRLTEKTPSMGAHGLHFCDRTSRAALEVLQRRLHLGEASDLRPRLALDVLISAFHWALARWTERSGEPTRAQLVSDLREAFAAVPGSLTLRAELR
ncbi:TetR/AcrR family transcriptional regulator [Streptomyces monticola]|uniref:TetR/AcrR family transcriptional regulator n=1 Tax=Streptomyces monticola TaxID=2666263 RepID=A0ABW2JN00_9ACTN